MEWMVFASYRHMIEKGANERNHKSGPKQGQPISIGLGRFVIQPIFFPLSHSRFVFGVFSVIWRKRKGKIK